MNWGLVAEVTSLESPVTWAPPERSYFASNEIETHISFEVRDMGGFAIYLLEYVLQIRPLIGRVLSHDGCKA